MALLLQKALDGSNELKLIHKLSGDVDAQQLVLRGSNFKEVVENQVYIARYIHSCICKCKAYRKQECYYGQQNICPLINHVQVINPIIVTV